MTPETEARLRRRQRHSTEQLAIAHRVQHNAKDPEDREGVGRVEAVRDAETARQYAFLGGKWP